MTRKHYEQLARILATVGAESQASAEICAKIGGMLSDYLEQDSPRFDALRFRDAYMVTLWEKQAETR